MVEDVEKSDKLVKLTVDFGDQQRQVIVGMKQALFVVNLEPKVTMGELSEAMLFNIGYSDKIIPVLAVPEKPVSNGVMAG